MHDVKYQRIKRIRCILIEYLIQYCLLLLLNRKEKEEMVIQLSNEGKTIREIAKTVHISLKNICKIINKEMGNDDYLSQQEKDKELENEKQKKWKTLSPYAKAFQMFKDKKPLEDVAIELDIKTTAVLDHYKDYLMLTRMSLLVKIYNELKNEFPLILHLYNRVKKEGLNKQDITDLLQNKNKLIDLNEQVEFYNNCIYELKAKKSILEQEINRLQSRMDNYYGISAL